MFGVILVMGSTDIQFGRPEMISIIIMAAVFSSLRPPCWDLGKCQAFEVFLAVIILVLRLDGDILGRLRHLKRCPDDMLAVTDLRHLPCWTGGSAPGDLAKEYFQHVGVTDEQSEVIPSCFRR